MHKKIVNHIYKLQTHGGTTSIEVRIGKIVCTERKLILMDLDFQYGPIPTKFHSSTLSINEYEA